MEFWQIIGSFIACAVLGLAAGGLYQPAGPLTAARVLRHLQRSYPDMKTEDDRLWLSSDRLVGLCPLGGGDNLGLVMIKAGRVVCRHIRKGDITALEEQPMSLRVTLADFTLPALAVRTPLSRRKQAVVMLSAVMTKDRADAA